MNLTNLSQTMPRPIGKTRDEGTPEQQGRLQEWRQRNRLQRAGDAMKVVLSQPCAGHDAPAHLPCWCWPSSRGEVRGVCGHRIAAAGY